MNIIYYISNTLSYIPPVIMFVSIILNFKNLKYFAKKEIALYVLICYAFINEVASRIVSEITSNNLIFINLFAIVYLVTLYTYMFYNNMKFKKIKTIVFILLFIFNLYEIFTINYTDIKEFQTYSFVLNSIFLLIISILQLLSKMKDENYNSFNEYMFISSFAMFTLINLPINIIVNYRYIFIYIFWILNIFTISLFYYFISKYLWKFGKIQKL